MPLRGNRHCCATVCPRAPLSSRGSRSARPQAFPQCLAARLARCWRSGNQRADMRPETRDLAGGHETLRQVEIDAVPMARPQGRQSLNVSCLTRSQCLAVSMSRQVSCLRSLVSPLPPPLARHRIVLVSREAVLQCAPCARTQGSQTLRTSQCAPQKRAGHKSGARKPRAIHFRPVRGGPSARGGRNDFTGNQAATGASKGGEFAERPIKQGVGGFLRGQKPPQTLFNFFLAPPCAASGDVIHFNHPAARLGLRGAEPWPKGRGSCSIEGHVP